MVGLDVSGVLWPLGSSLSTGSQHGNVLAHYNGNIGNALVVLCSRKETTERLIEKNIVVSLEHRVGSNPVVHDILVIKEHQLECSR